MHQNMKRINRKLEYGSCGSLRGILNIIIWNHATLIGTDKIIKSLTDRPNEIFLRVSVKKLWALHRIKEKLNSHFDSTDKKEAIFILTLAVIKEKVSWVGGDEPIKDHKKRRLHKEHLWGSDFLSPGCWSIQSVWVTLCFWSSKGILSPWTPGLSVPSVDRSNAPNLLLGVATPCHLSWVLAQMISCGILRQKLNHHFSISMNTFLQGRRLDLKIVVIFLTICIRWDRGRQIC